ncbi:MAG: glycosyltransferase family 4 protein [Desulfobacterales bacterium]|nr:glycosyltransferase family 4 protein [Desulfobacterales bacterium]
MILALFFTRGVSLETWVNTGLFDREKLIYQEHLRCGHLKAVYWLTYGSHDAELAKELRAEKRLHPSIQVIPMPLFFKGKIGKVIYSFLMPLLQKTCLMQADIYKTNQMDGSWSAVFAKWLYHKSLIVRTGYTLSLFEKRLKKRKSRIFIYRLIEWLAYRHATWAVVTSERDKKYISDKYGRPEKSIATIPNFIDTDLFKPQKNEKYGDRIVFVGRLSKEKNLFNLISALRKTGLRLDMYGKGELRDALEQHAKNEGARVNFMGTRPNSKLPDIFNRYKYYILSSYFEGMPKTLLEAMACGLVCIGTNVEGITEIVKHNDSGLLCGTNADSISHAINVLMNDGNLRDCLGKNARRFVCENCSLDRIVDREYAFYKELLSSND